MRWAFPIAIALVAGCAEEQDFDEKFERTERELNEKAKELDRELERSQQDIDKTSEPLRDEQSGEQ